MKNLLTNKVPVLFVGAPGVGKTAVVKQCFDYVEVILTSTMVEEDAAGIPYREGEYDYRTIPALFRRLREADEKGLTTCLFFDELDKARRSVADTLLTLVASRRIGDAALPERTCIVAAANPPQYGGGDGVSDAMISRFSVVDFVPSVSGWADWAGGKFKSPAAVRVIEAVRGGIIPLIECVGEGLDKRISSPRTISLALEYLEEKGSSDDFERIATGLLTANVASLCISRAKVIKNDSLEKSVSTKLKALKHTNGIKPMVF